MKVINSSQDVLKVSKLKHFSDYEPEGLIMDLGLYDSLLVDTTNVDIHDYVTPDKKMVAESGIDVLTLHDFAFLKKPIMLPCPYCGREQAFISRDGFINPMDRSIFKSENVRKRKKEKPSDIVHVDNEVADYVDYDFTNDKITVDLAYGDQYFDKNRLENEIAGKILDGIIKTAKDIRKDFVCSYDEDHHIFVEFTLSPVVDSVSSELIDSLNKSDEAAKLFFRLFNCLIARKVAQYPSMADLQFFDKVKYKHILGKQYKDYTMALGLYASGVGVGALVYLRRIFENIVEGFHQKCIIENEWNEDEYCKLRFNEKISYLEDFGITIIPDELNNVRTKLYGVLSKGIHSASDDECKSLFPYMKFAIETLLDKKIEENNKQKKIVELNREIGGYT